MKPVTVIAKQRGHWASQYDAKLVGLVILRARFFLMNFSGFEKESAMKFTPVELLKLTVASCYGDFLMALYDQTKPYEKTPGQADALLKEGLSLIERSIHKGTYVWRRHYYKKLLKIFSAIKIPEERKPRVGIVGEIYVKYSPLANNHLADFLVKEGCEVEEPPLMEFLLYCAKNAVNDHAAR